MKVPSAIRNLYEELKERYILLSERVQPLMISKKDYRWHYEGRIKTLESYALKLETGRFPSGIEDFFACTLVVENLQTRSKAEALICNEFVLIERRPKRDNFTHKGADAFPFDDLRLYVKWKDPEGAKPSGLTDLTFEVQIKTFLQHAWAVATHDMIYKSDTKNWAKDRIAFQIKAMLEHAEISILEADTIASSPALNKTNRATKRCSKIINIVHKFWPSDRLPADLLRLADNVSALLSALDLGEQELEIIIEAENRVGRGSNAMNLSPFGAILQSIINQKPDDIANYLTATEQTYKIIVTKDIEFPSGIEVTKSKNACFLG
ncbi:hypothetical protein KP003_18780 [Geomonas nitrogeniifigens]|uniref:hypothetical protein n=1 Tax=Geomonas diazotrophica TaxID=2843197 RepID=UPI001C2C6F2F|nr:hypothetical protein [Geomonas nitrogeniifigens]QXE86377.1 hypothetical protein KP003_18780 [Geomonas nitrogeniifigens]